MGEDRIAVTKEGKARLEKELADLEIERPKILKAIEEARAMGDLKEYADYHCNREALSMLETKSRELKYKLSRSYIVEEPEEKDRALFGATVRVKNHKLKKEKTYVLVGQGEDNPKEGKILTTSPIGQALLRKKVGEDTIFVTPAGETKLSILEITYE
jgi:transcription elongation factor GreA